MNTNEGTNVRSGLKGLENVDFNQFKALLGDETFTAMWTGIATIAAAYVDKNYDGVQIAQQTLTTVFHLINGYQGVIGQARAA